MQDTRVISDWLFVFGESFAKEKKTAGEMPSLMVGYVSKVVYLLVFDHKLAHFDRGEASGMLQPGVSSSLSPVQFTLPWLATVLNCAQRLCQLTDLKCPSMHVYFNTQVFNIVMVLLSLVSTYVTTDNVDTGT